MPPLATATFVLALTSGAMTMSGRTGHRRLIAVLAATAALTAVAATGVTPSDRLAAQSEASQDSGGFVYRAGQFTPLSAVPGAAFSLTVGINNQGQTTGVYVDADAVPGPDGTLPDGTAHGFVRDRQGHVVSFGVAKAGLTRSQAINNRGELAGDYVDPGAVPGPDGLSPRGTIHGFTRDSRGDIHAFDVPFDHLHVIKGMNDRGQIVGYYDSSGTTQGSFVREPDGRVTLITYPGAPITEVYGINNQEQIVGAFLQPGAAVGPDGTVQPGTVHGLIWERGRFTTLDVPGATTTQAFGINDRGQIVGGYRDANGNAHAFILDRGRYRAIDAPDRPADTGTMATTINDLDEIVIPERVDGLVPVATDHPGDLRRPRRRPIAR